MNSESSCMNQWLSDQKLGSHVVPGVLLALLAGGCAGPNPEELDASPEMESETSGLSIEEVVSLYGLGTNGLGTNGLGTNGLGTNGLGTNGLSLSTLSSTPFVEWFNQDPAVADMVMHYIVECAVPNGSTLTWQNPVTRTQYTWTGNLGLTPGWAGGAPATETEQQLITACLAAHTNAYGAHVDFSLQGLKANTFPISLTPGELHTYSQREGCFFGNLFRDEGIFSGSDDTLPSTDSSVRACGLSIAGAENACAPIQHLGRCEEMCVPDLLHNFYLSCYHNGKFYRALTTRIQPSDVYVCGDGVCQISESCGTGNTPNNCTDCGPCT